MPINEYDDLLSKQASGEDVGIPSDQTEYESILDSEKKEKKSIIQQSMMVASESDPQRQAEVLDISRRNKVPPIIVENNFQEFKKRDFVNSNDYDQIIEKNPNLATWLEKPENAKLGRDDISSLSRIEAGTSRVKKTASSPIGNALETGWNNLLGSSAHLAAAYGLTDLDSAASFIAEKNKRSRELEKLKPNFAVEYSQAVEKEAGDVQKAWNRLVGSYDKLKEGQVLDALIDFGAGGGLTVAESIDLVLSATVARPRGLVYATAENAANSLPGLLAGFAGGKAGAVGGAAAGSVIPGAGTAAGAAIGGISGFVAGGLAGGIPTEIGAWINQGLQEKGFDITDPESIKKAYSDPKLMAEIRAEAERKGITTAGVDAVFNLFAGRFIAKSVSPKGAGLLRRAAGKTSDVAKDIGVQAAGEAASEFSGQVAARKGDLAKVDFGESILEGVLSLGHSVGDTVIGGSIRGAFSKNPSKAATEISKETAKAVNTIEAARTINETAKAIRESKTYGRSKEKVQELLNTTIGAEDTSSVFFQSDDWNNYWRKKGKSPAEASNTLNKDNGKSYHESNESDSQIEVPIQDFLSETASLDETEFQELLSIARTDPEGPSVSEARSNLESLPATMEELSQEAVEEKEFQTKFQASAETVRVEVENQLRNTGLDQKTSSQYSQLYEAAFRSLGERTGIDPSVLYKEYGLDIRRRSDDSIIGELNQDTLEQPGDDTPRGRIKIGEGTSKSFNIELLKNADLSTFLHETGHFYTEVLADIANREDASPQVKEDFATLIQWAGFESVEKWNATDINGRREAHEKIARGFETYLLEGKAPTKKLQRAFNQFRSWLVAIYRQAINLNADLTNDVRDVFNRLLATEDELMNARQDLGSRPIFEDLTQSGMNEKDATRYTKAIEESRDSATEKLLKKFLKTVKQKRTKAYKQQEKKVRKQVTDLVNQERNYIVLSVLQSGTMPDGSAPALILRDIGKISRDGIVDAFGKDKLKQLPKGIFVKEGGLHHDAAADLFGFSSGDEMLTMLQNLPDKKTYIETLTGQRMKELTGDFLTDGDLSTEAMNAVNNESHSKRLQLELKHLASNDFAKFKGLANRILKRPAPIEAIKVQAQNTIDTRKVRHVTPGIYLRAQKKHARLAREAFFRGDFEAAFDSKQRELFNHELYKAAVKAKADVEAGNRFINKFSKKETRERIGKVSQENLGIIDGIMERFDFRKNVSLRTIDKRKGLKAWYESQKEEGLNPVISDNLLSEAFKKHYKDLTVQEFMEVRDAIKSIDHLTQLKTKLLSSKRKRDFNATIEEVVASIEANSKGKKKQDLESRLPQDELKRLGVGFLASHRKFSSILREMDGFKDGGVMWETLTRPINEAGDRESTMNERSAEKLNQIFGRYTLKEKASLYKKEMIPEINDSLTRAGRIAVALNFGNADNKRKLLQGRNWSNDQAKAILDGLTKKDWEIVQDIWDLIDSYWEETKSLSQRIDGIAPQKIEATPVETKFGTFRGGYYPIKYDESQSPKAYGHRAKEAADNAMRGATVRATTQSGFRKERVENVNLPIRLDLEVAFQHIQDVIHDQTHYETLIDANRLLGDKRIQTSIIENYGHEKYSQLRDAIRDIAAGDVPARDSLERGLNWVRGGASIAAMGWNLSTALIQPLGLTQSMTRVGPKWFARAFSRFYGDANRMQGMTSWIHSKSELMRLRAKTMNREINEIRNNLRLKGALLGKLEGSYFALIAKTQMMVDIPTWAAVYEKQMSVDPTDEKRAIAIADQTVLDTQGGGQVKDLAGVQKGSPLKKLWTNFFSYFSVTYNLLTESVKARKFDSVEELGRFAVDFMLLVPIPAALGMFLRDAIKGELDFDDDELWKKLAQENASYLTGLLVGVREISSVIQGFHGYSGPAGTRFFAELGGLASQIAQGEVDEALLRSLNKTGGILFHYPATQVDRTARGFMSFTQGKSGISSILTGPPRNK